MGSIPAAAEAGQSVFDSLPPPEAGGPFALEGKYHKDIHDPKVNLIIGAYRDDEGSPWSLRSVTEAKRRLHIENCLHEYSPLKGDAEFLNAARLLVFGQDILSVDHGAAVASIQTVSGTGANTLIARFLDVHARPRRIWLPDPTWINHKDIWEAAAPGVEIAWYTYYDSVAKSLDFKAMMHSLRTQSQTGDAILLHACAHNPTGIDPTMAQWKEIAQLCVERSLFVVFDSAYQGFASGDLAHDAWAIRHFYRYTSIEFAVCQSFSKNLGLYSERIGALHIVVNRAYQGASAATVEHHLIQLHRAFVSMAPAFGARVASSVLNSPDLYEMWQKDLQIMSDRIKTMRRTLHDGLIKLRTPGNWDHIVQQTGMFSYTGLSAAQVARLELEFHVYMLPTGRASICGLTEANVAYTAAAIDAVVRESHVKQ